MQKQLRLLLITPDPKDNALGRTYCLWLLAKHLGWTPTVVTVAGSVVWEPLRESDLGRGLISLDPADRDTLRQLVSDSDVVIAVKPLPTTLGAVYDVANAARRPLLVDVDDPDVEVRTIWRPWHERVPRRFLQPRYREMVRMGRLARQLPTLVSNPVLREIYGGEIVPHVRSAAPLREHRDTDSPLIRFVGSVKGHKGVDVLRDAVARLADDGFTLEVTAPPPADPKPWERWIGQTTIAHGQQLVADADIIAIPSLNEGWAPGQLPAKLIDAMMFGRAIVASDIAPIRWALDDTGILVRAGDVDELVEALRRLGDRGARQQYGAAAHMRAGKMFSVEAIAPTLEGVVDRLLSVTEASTT